jgi:hypothetical protein
MNTFILFWYLVCHGGVCHPEPLEVTREALAIISCESGDGYNYGTYSRYARSATNDGGLFQFNDGTYLGLTGRDYAEYDTPANQYAAFRELWNQGKGWQHWKSSQACWSQWMRIDDEGVAVWKNH